MDASLATQSRVFNGLSWLTFHNNAHDNGLINWKRHSILACAVF